MKKIIVLSLLIAALVVTFYPAFTWMFDRFQEEDSYYSHGFLIPLVSAFLIWRKKSELSTMAVSNSGFGLFLLVFGLILHLAGGVVFRIGFISGVSLLIVLFGLSLYLFGGQVTKAVSFPVSFLMFMVPLPKVLLIGITFKMKMLAAYIAAILISSLNITIQRAGSMIYLPNGVLTVGNECSGINSLISLFTLSVLFAYVMEKSMLKRYLFVLFSFPIALTANIVRIGFLILAAYIYGVEAATKGFLHYGAGVTLWIVALVMLTGFWRLLQWQPGS